MEMANKVEFILNIKLSFFYNDLLFNSMIYQTDIRIVKEKIIELSVNKTFSCPALHAKINRKHFKCKI